MKKTLLPILAALIAVSAHAAQTVYLKPHEVFAEAIKHGKAQGELQGEVAEHFTRELHSTGPLFVSTKIIKRYKQEGCAQLETVFTKKEVDTPKGKTDAVLKTRLNYCKDGTPPVLLD